MKIDLPCLKTDPFSILLSKFTSMNSRDTLQAGQTMICNKNYLADVLRVCEINDLIWVMRFQRP